MLRLLGFECFSVETSEASARAVAAGTSTLRNPCYLLSKLRMPNALDDPQFLPLVTVPDCESTELFYHYRQFRLSLDSDMSLLLYPACSLERRSESFRTLNSLTGGISYFVDPRTHERALRLSDCVVRPILVSRGFPHSGETSLEIIDIGAGSGGLTASLCRHLTAFGESARFEPKFKLWFVDLDPADPARFFENSKLRDLFDSATYVGDDYRRWLVVGRMPPPTDGIRIGIASKLFNNLSRFSVRPLAQDEIMGTSANYQPSLCLLPPNADTGALIISNSRVQLRDGRTFLQQSLSEFYRGLACLDSDRKRLQVKEAGLFAPIRSFSPESLVTVEGDSVISMLLGACPYLIIVDSDLRPDDLVEHLSQFSLSSVGALDMSKPLALRGNYAYVLWREDRVLSAPPLIAERVW